MSDFFQHGDICILHRLRERPVDELEAEISHFAQTRPIALVLPCLYSELEGSALPNIVKELQQVPYLHQIVVGLDQADEKQFYQALDFFHSLPQKVRVLWNDSPRIQALVKELDKEGVAPGEPGKGRNAWMCFGYIIACDEAEVIALHDCDILTYTREMLARLCYPTANPNMSFEFCKGYYARVTDRFHGRVTRLFVTPLIRSLARLLGENDYLSFLDSFRYPLAGEFSMATFLARRNRFPGDWGLEIGILSEVYRNCSKKEVCQVDLCDTYDHKHSPLSKRDSTKGLRRMSLDIAKCLFRTLGSTGAIFPAGFFQSLKATYLRTAQDLIERYSYDAAINGLIYHRHSEEEAIETFAKSIEAAGEQYFKDPLGTPLISNWNRIISAVPIFLEQLKEIIEQENRRPLLRQVFIPATNL
jgi:glucosyl-3-phosphoglycerate synthase